MLLYLVLSSVRRAACLHGGWKSCRTLGPRCPQSRAWKLLVPALGADAGMAVPQGLKLGSHGVGLLGGGWYRRGGWIALEPLETLPLLPPGAQATLESHLTN